MSIRGSISISRIIRPALLSFRCEVAYFDEFLLTQLDGTGFAFRECHDFVEGEGFMIGEILCCGMHFCIDAFAEFEFDALHFVVELESHPKSLFHTKIAGQAEVVFRSATATAVLHLGEMGSEDAGGFRDVFLGGWPLIQCLAKSLGEGVGKIHGFHSILMVIDDLNLVGVIVFP